MKKIKKTNILSGLSKQVLFWFMLLSLTPLCINSFFSYQSVRGQLYKNAVRSLADLSAANTRFIRTSFERIVVDLAQEAERESTKTFLRALSEAYKETGEPLEEFARSYRWAMVGETYATELNAFRETYGYYDIFLIDKEGNILFSFAKESDLGKNLFQGQLALTRFSMAAKKALESERIVFSDLEYYSPSANIMAGFLTAPLHGKSGEVPGMIAFQLSGKKLEQLVGQEARFGETGRRYLIGPDLKLRTPGGLGDGFPALQKMVNTKGSERWYEEHISKTSVADIDGEQVYTYVGPNGKPVLGVHTNVEVGDISWGYIAEINEEEALGASKDFARVTLLLMGIMFFVVVMIALPVTRSIVLPVVEISQALTKVGEGNLQQYIDIHSGNELGTLARGFNSMILSLRESERRAKTQRWLQEGTSRLKDHMQGDQPLLDLTRNIISFLSQYLDAKVGAFYVVKGDTIQLTGSYAFSIRKGFRKEFAVGEGMIGQAAQGKQTLVFSDIPDDYLTITSGLGETRPRIITICPVVWDNEVLALLEFGTITSLSTLHKNLVEAVTPAIAVAVQTSMSREQTKELLEQTQNQAEELRAREEELRDTNRILERQARELKRSEVLLRSNHAQMEDRNRQLQSQQLELEQKAKDLALSSKYKSEFLANMSHELRTPLNSMLILSQLLSENKNGNLSEKQVEFARTIHASGADLVALIHDILDLSKVEAGKMNMNVEPVALDAFISALESKFRPVAENKGISLKFEVAPPPEPWQCDSQKLGQIVKNLLSNAIKFTEKGGVTLRLALAKPGTTFETPGLKPEATLAIEVIDSGIGIAGEKRAIIFEAFQQADGTTSRKFGGTGLGLSISRELAKLLGGEIHVESTPGQGSTFTLFVPLTPTPVIPVEAKDSAKTPSSENGASGTTGTVQEPEQGDARSLPAHTPPTEEPDDRDEIKPEDRSILVIEDDSRFASVVAESARSRGFKVLLSCTGKNGLHLADHFTPSGIVLDIELPNIDGWEVLQRLKRSPKTRHIPVCFVSANESSVDAIKNGAVGFLAKPAAVEDVEFALGRIEGVIDRAVRRLLLVDKDPGQIERVRTLVGGGDIEIVEAKTGAEAKKQLSEGGPDCIAMDIRLPDMNGLDLLDTLRTDTALQQIPVVVYTGKEMGPHERNTLNRYSQSIAIKDVHSPERLLDYTTLFLHRVESNLPAKQQQMIRMLYDNETAFTGRKVLVVDDDMRNVYALSEILQDKKMEVLVAINGLEALKKLAANTGISIVLMDIMMPGMDGYDAIRKIREQSDFVTIPIIVLTAKAMKGDRGLCIDAGASDYLAKPVHPEKLLSMMRVWLYR